MFLVKFVPVSSFGSVTLVLAFQSPEGCCICQEGINLHEVGTAHQLGGIYKLPSFCSCPQPTYTTEPLAICPDTICPDTALNRPHCFHCGQIAKWQALYCTTPGSMQAYSCSPQLEPFNIHIYPVQCVPHHVLIHTQA